MRSLLLIALVAAGCEENNIRSCGIQCDTVTTKMVHYSSRDGCVCGDLSKEDAQAWAAAREPEAVRFCGGCSKRCADAGKKLKLCKFGNDTWGAGPDVCECETPSP